MSGGHADDAEVRTEPPVEVLPERDGDPGVVIDDDDDWLGGIPGKVPVLWYSYPS